MPVLGVIGSRDYIYRDRVWEYLDKVLEKHGDDLGLVSGACKEGPDLFGEEWAKERGVPIMLFPAAWKRPGQPLDRGAGFKRNGKIVKFADVLVAFWDGKSKGTRDSIEKAWKMGKKVLVTSPRTAMRQVHNYNDLADISQANGY